MTRQKIAHATPDTTGSVQHLSETDLAAAGTAAGRAWIASLPSLVVDLASAWDLTIRTSPNTVQLGIREPQGHWPGEGQSVEAKRGGEPASRAT